MVKTLKEIVADLRALGHNVEVYQRMDIQGRKRGLIIRRIDGISFQGSKGNEYARNLVGASLSQYQQEQMKRLNEPQGNSEKALNKLAPSKRKKEALDKETQARLRRIQRLYRKKGAEYGLPTTAKYRWNVEHFGKAEAERLLSQAERYAKGLAYEDNIQYLIGRLEADNNKISVFIGKNAEDTELYPIVEKIKNYNRDNFTEDKLKDILNATYQLEQQINNALGNQQVENEINVAISIFKQAVESIL